MTKRKLPRARWRLSAPPCKKGITVLPATGRTVTGVPKAFLEIPGVRYALTSNGASVVDLQTGEKLVSLPFDMEQAERAFDVLEDYGGMLSIFIDGESYTTTANAQDSLSMVPENLREYFRSTRNEVPDMHAMMEAHPGRLKNSAFCTPPRRNGMPPGRRWPKPAPNWRLPPASSATWS